MYYETKVNMGKCTCAGPHHKQALSDSGKQKISFCQYGAITNYSIKVMQYSRGEGEAEYENVNLKIMGQNDFLPFCLNWVTNFSQPPKLKRIRLQPSSLPQT